MKRLFACLLFITAGIFCGVVISLFDVAFEPKNCGEDCVSRNLESLFTWVAVCVFSFSFFGLRVWSRMRQTLKSLAAIVMVLMTIPILPAILIYCYELHTRYWTEDSWKREIPNMDFSDMVIATKPVIASRIGGSDEKIQVKAWERCALGYADCDRNPRAVEVACLGDARYVLLDESSWPAFQRIPDEDLLAGSRDPAERNLSVDLNPCAHMEQDVTTNLIGSDR
ncbi:MAG: hypothetical protein LBI31_02635 [Zoogloeaceae bacterium]|nr:hypothetical protein [Zoogloeaceae bacterium]